MEEEEEAVATTQWIFPFFFSSFFRFWLSKGKERKREEGEGVKATKVPLQMAVKRGEEKEKLSARQLLVRDSSNK